MGRLVQIQHVRYFVSPQTRIICTEKICLSALGGFPALIEVTLEELETGLEAGEFTSVDLVNVCFGSRHGIALGG